MAVNNNAGFSDPQLLPKKNEQLDLCGYYYDQGNTGDVKGALTKEWFQSQALSGSLLKRLNSIQLITSSHDKGSEVAEASRSWFELSILRGDALIGVSWMSHENRFKTQVYEYHKGRVFTRHSDILKSLKDGDRIQVHAAADYENFTDQKKKKSENHYKKGILIFGVGCEDSEKPVEDSKLRGLLELDLNGPEVASSVVDLGLTKPEYLKRRIQQEGVKAVMGNLEWESWDRIGEYKSLAAEAKEKQKHVLLVFDAEDLPDSTAIERRLSWGQTVQNIWEHEMKGRCNTIWNETNANKYFHLLVQLGLEGAIYKGFQKDATKVHLIYEPTSAKGGFLRSYSNKDMENLRVKSADIGNLRVSEVDLEKFKVEGALTIVEDQGVKVKDLMETERMKEEIGRLREEVKGKAREEVRRQLMENLRKQLRKDVGVVWMKGLKSSLKEESTESIASLDIMQIRDATMTGIRWSRRCAPMMFPKRKAKQSQPADNRLKLETDSEPVLVSVELDLRDSQTTSKEPLVLKSLPCSLKNAAQDTLKQGFDCVLPYMPSARFGNLVTADRGEVDGFRKIANTVHKWYTTNTDPIPLSIAVFGQPGSGKSFGVKEVIKSILAADGKRITDLEYNLSQFRQEDDLRHAFEVIRGKALSEEMPVVFFDEFDSTFQGRGLGWLPHFVKPITEGVYEDGETKRPLGRGIYIFIGGTKTKYDDFFEDISSNSAPAENLEKSNTSEDTVTNVGDSAPVESPKRPIDAAEEELYELLQQFYESNLTPMGFNISKMSRYDQLKESFYEIRDKTLAKVIPVVFFEGFDSDFESEELGWLKYFLAPMQDGEFFDHGSRHPLGRAIFVFEQTTHHFNRFPTARLDSEKYSGAKAPDFVSRLRGHIHIGNGTTDQGAKEDEMQVKNKYTALANVLTWYREHPKVNKPLSIALFQECPQLPDPVLRAQETFKTTLKGYVDILGPSFLEGEGEEKDADMNYFPIRRAILLRSMLERNFGFTNGKPISMEPGVINALLFTPSVLHGARSLESILSMSIISPEKAAIKPADICKADQRKLHVDADNDSIFQGYLDQNRSLATEDSAENKRRYAWIERKSGRAYNPGTVVPATPAAGSGGRLKIENFY